MFDFKGDLYPKREQHSSNGEEPEKRAKHDDVESSAVPLFRCTCYRLEELTLNAQGRTKKYLLNLVRDVPSGLMGCASAALKLVASRREGNSIMQEILHHPVEYKLELLLL